MRQRLARYLWIPCLAALAPPAASGQEVGRTPELDAEQPTSEERFFDWTAPTFPVEEYVARRERFLDAMGDAEGIVLITSAHGLSHGDTFRQSDDFNYFTGLELPGSVLVLDIPSRRPTLFVPERDFRFESPTRRNDFPGRALSSDPALSEVSQIVDIRPFDQLDLALREWARRNVNVYVNPGRPGVIRRVVTTLIADWDPALLTLFHLQTTHPDLHLRNAYEPVAFTRMVKSEREIEAMRASVSATAASIRAAAREIRAGVTERDLEAAFEGGCKRNGAQRIAFASIIKSGPNSLWPWRVLASHYDRRNRAMEDGDLVIFDVGCEVDYYVSDVGRTFPVSGQFTPEQAAILEMEVAVADAIIGAIRPGVTLSELQAVGNATIPREHRRFMQTGLFFGHHIGLSTGDPNLPDLPLEAGMVFTVEPWYYNHEIGISVFTEDVILVTETGAEILSSSLPRDGSGLEALVRP